MLKLLHGDCMEVMDILISEQVKVDAIITSPPYNKAGYAGFIHSPSIHDTWKRRNIDYDDDPANDFMPENEYQEWQINFLNKCGELLHDDGSIFYNHKVRVANHKASHPIEWILKTNLIFRQQLVWNRKASPVVAPIRYLPNTELIFWLTKYQIQPNFNRQKDLVHKGEVWEILASKNDPHPATFPIELIDNILPNLKQNALILDPFMGIGTTGLSCKKHNCSFIGIEKSNKYFEIANNRINDLTKQESMI
jgi:site-specific DNA-methyltransferase (adenine-specific)